MKPEALEAYQWPPSSEVIAERWGVDPRSIVRFDGNVAASAPASARPAAIARALADVNEYDRGRYQRLREAIARRHDLDVEQVALGAGSDEFIVLLARLFAEGGTIATVPAFSYSMYRFAAIMAGARVGYALATRDLTRVITSRQAPLSVSSLSAALALAAISTPLEMSGILAERERLSQELAGLGLTPLRSYTNFLFIPMDDPGKLVEQLLPHGAVTRAYPGGLRVSVRDEFDNNFLLDALRTVLLGTPMPSPALRYERHTAETLLKVRLRVAGEGRVYVHTGAGFYDHMLQQLAFHAGMDLRLEGVGDLETGDHHTVEDMMLTFGEALDRALGDRKGLARYGEARVPMDEALAHAVVDLSGRATATLDISPDEGMVQHAFTSLVQSARITLHVTASGENPHHVAEASFKAVGRALAQAVAKDGSLVRSTKGSL